MFARLLRPAAAVIAAVLWIITPYPASADLKEILNAGVVRIGVPVDVPPFGFVDERQQPAENRRVDMVPASKASRWRNTAQIVAHPAEARIEIGEIAVGQGLGHRISHDALK